MAMNRASFAKTLEPGLNTLFGLEYDSYPAEYAAVFESNSSQKAYEEDVLLSGLAKRQQKLRVERSLMTAQANSGLRVTSTKLSPWRSQSLRKLKRTVSMVRLLRVTQRRWHGLWHRPKKLRLQTS